mmetsp:Transcript_23705/g.59159  ORF Transcript_23705/g.59159 Transcript_23705/m.59159 type:complete len:242 (-) Transcript_23705:264-989(-)
MPWRTHEPRDFEPLELTARAIGRPALEQEPLSQAQLDGYGEALELVESLRGPTGGQHEMTEGIETGNSMEASQTSTMADDLARPSELVEDPSVWEQVYSHMDMATEELSQELRRRRASSARGALPSGCRRPPPAGISGAQPRPSQLPQQPAFGELPARPPMRPLKSSFKRLLPVVERSGRRPFSDAAPLHVHSIDRFLDRTPRGFQKPPRLRSRGQGQAGRAEAVAADSRGEDGTTPSGGA